MARWYNAELPRETAGQFKEYLRDNSIRFEPSECGNLIHFECYMTETQADAANAFIDGMCGYSKGDKKNG